MEKRYSREEFINTLRDTENPGLLPDGMWLGVGFDATNGKLLFTFAGDEKAPGYEYIESVSLIGPALDLALDYDEGDCVASISAVDLQELVRAFGFEEVVIRIG